MHAAGVNSGRLDFTYIAPDGTKFRSQNQALQHLGLDRRGSEEPAGALPCCLALPYALVMVSALCKLCTKVAQHVGFEHRIAPAPPGCAGIRTPRTSSHGPSGSDFDTRLTTLIRYRSSSVAAGSNSTARERPERKRPAEDEPAGGDGGRPRASKVNARAGIMGARRAGFCYSGISDADARWVQVHARCAGGRPVEKPLYTGALSGACAPDIQN